MKIAAIIFLVFCSVICHAQSDIQWQKRFGGLGIDQAACIIQTTDNGYAVIGRTDSNDSVVYGNHGSNDYLFFKLDAGGNQQWHRWYGSSGFDIPKSIIQTNDGGYLLAGVTNANDGDVSGNHGGSDIWLIKTNSLGFIEWQNCYGGTGNEGLERYGYGFYASFPAGIPVINTIDGGYIFASSTTSNDGQVSGNFGGYDYWVVKLNTAGTLQWQRCYGGNKDDIATSIIQNNDGTYVIAGYTNSDSSGQVTGMHAACYDDWNYGILCPFDYWIIKIDTAGLLIWQKDFGGTANDIATSICHTSDGGYLVAGFSDSNNGDVTGKLGYQNYWLVKIDSSGSLIWENCYGGSQSEQATSVVTTTDGGYFIVGNSTSDDIEITNHHDTLYHSDIWAVKLDTFGNIQWQKSFGGTMDDFANCVIKTTDGGYAIAGYTDSNDGDVSASPAAVDFWVIKLNPNVGINEIKSQEWSVNIYPNPFSNTATFSITGPISESLTLTIYNLLGQEIITRLIIDHNKEIIFNKEQLPDGIYFYKLSDSAKNSMVNGKIIIQ